MAERNFNAKQALESEIKDLYAKFESAAPVAASVVLIFAYTITATDVGAERNGDTFELVVNAPAANPADTVLLTLTGTEDAVVATVTPNDGTNNGAVAVAVTGLEFVEAMNTGAISGKNLTLLDTGSLRTKQTLANGSGSPMPPSDDTGTLTGGVDGGVTAVSTVGFAKIERTGVGEFTLTLQDAYFALRSADAIVQSATAMDVGWQLTSQAVNDSSDKTVVLQASAGASPVEIDGEVLVKLELKNSSARN